MEDRHGNGASAGGTTGSLSSASEHRARCGRGPPGSTLVHHASVPSKQLAAVGGEESASNSTYINILRRDHVSNSRRETRSSNSRWGSGHVRGNERAAAHPYGFFLNKDRLNKDRVQMRDRFYGRCTAKSASARRSASSTSTRYSPPIKKPAIMSLGQCAPSSRRE